MYPDKSIAEVTPAISSSRAEISMTRSIGMVDLC